MRDELRRALVWWQTILTEGIVEEQVWHLPVTAPIHLFCDARGQPPHLGAVAFLDGQCLWTHMEPDAAILSRFRSRADNQILGLELLSISLAFCTFEQQLYGRKIVVHSDNTGSEACLFRLRVWGKWALVIARLR